MFDWAIASPYFSIRPYQELAKTLEVRAKHRATIHKFIDYLKDKQITKTYQYFENRDDYLPLIVQHFPEADLLGQIEREKEVETISQQMSEKFNGKLVMRLIPELNGQELGKFIVNFKKQFDNFETFLLESSLQEIQEKILSFNRLIQQKNEEEK